MNKAPFVLAGILALGAGQAVAQTCDTTKPEATPVSRFKDNGNGTLTDTKTHLIWRRCAIGMTWNGTTCEGQSHTYNYRDTLYLLEDMNAKKEAGHSDWRLPTNDELLGIVEPRCFKPAINLEAFPFTPESGFWTSTDDPGVAPRARVIHFLNGGSYIGNKTQSWRIRPVAGQ